MVKGGLEQSRKQTENERARRGFPKTHILQVGTGFEAEAKRRNVECPGKDVRHTCPRCGDEVLEDELGLFSFDEMAEICRHIC